MEKTFADFYLDKNFSIKQIAAIFRISPRTVYSRAKAENLPIRSEKKYQIPEVGARFNRLTFIKEEIGTGHRKYWRCTCDCGVEKSFPYWNVYIGKSKSCGCYQKEKASKIHWSGFKEISGKYWTSVKTGASKRSLEFSISIEYAWEIYKTQKEICALSGIPIVFSRMIDRYPQTASIDRINNDIGYVEGNIQWLHKDINLMKHCFEQSYFLGLCDKVSTFKREVSNGQ